MSTVSWLCDNTERFKTFMLNTNSDYERKKRLLIQATITHLRKKGETAVDYPAVLADKLEKVINTPVHRLVKVNSIPSNLCNWFKSWCYTPEAELVEVPFEVPEEMRIDYEQLDQDLYKDMSRFGVSGLFKWLTQLAFSQSDLQEMLDVLEQLSEYLDADDFIRYHTALTYCKENKCFAELVFA